MTIHIGTVVGVKRDKPVVQVDILGRLTDWLPVLSQANSFKKQFTPLRRGEQVVVLANRVVIGSIYNFDCAEPTGADEKIDITEYEDGTRFEYDSDKKRLTIKAVGKIHIICKEASLKADLITVEAPNITLTGAIEIIGDISQTGKFKNTGGIETDGSVKDNKGDLTSHHHPKVAPRL